MKIRPVAAELFHADGRTDRQTDMTQLVVASGNFARNSKSISPQNDLQCTLQDAPFSTNFVKLNLVSSPYPPFPRPTDIVTFGSSNKRCLEL